MPDIPEFVKQQQKNHIWEETHIPLPNVLQSAQEAVNNPPQSIEIPSSQ